MSGIFINSDAWNFWNDNDFDSMNESGIRRDVDFYTEQGGVEAILYNMNFQRSFYPTRVGTPIWKDCEIRKDGRMYLRGKPLEEKVDREYRSLVTKAKYLNETLPNFMQIRYRYCHSKGVEMWHSMRMNDVHHTPLGLEHRPQHSDLWQTRKDLLRAWYRHFQRSIWSDNTFDYAQVEVYNYHLNMVKEYLLDYESDGIELDWMRCMPIFKPGFDELNTPILTQFMRDVRNAADEAEKKWGHKIRIAARVPSRPADAMGMGMDVPAWCNNHCVDVIIPGPFHHMTEQDTQIKLWRLLVPQPVLIAPCINCTAQCKGSWNIENVKEADLGFASDFYEQGADTMYIYNHFPGHGRNHPEIQDLFRLAGNRDAVAKESRRHIFTAYDPAGEGKFAEACHPPLIASLSSSGGIKINCGEAVKGRKAKVVIGTIIPVDINILVNTTPCKRLNPESSLPSPLPDKAAYYTQAEIPPDVLHNGWNVVELFNLSQDTLYLSNLVWLEIDIF